MQLREYQSYAIDSIWKYFQDGNQGNPIVAMPTGTGKSVVIGGFAMSVYQHFHNQRLLVLTHVQELIEQNFEKLITMWPSAPAGIYSSGLGRKDMYGKITFGGIQSIKGVAKGFGHIDLVIIDECHLVSPKQTTMYRQFLEDLKKINPHLKVIGLTATPWRLGLGSLTEGGMFTDVCCDMTTLEAFNWFFDQGYLSKLYSPAVEKLIDTSSVGVVAGEFNQGQLEKVSSSDAVTRKAIEQMLAYGQYKNHWLIFATGVEHCFKVQRMLEEAGIRTAVVSRHSSPDERREAIEGFKAGYYRALVNNNILTTGFDFAKIDMIGILRATMSSNLWVQMLGRGTRVVYANGFDLWSAQGRLDAIAAGGKPYCLVMDFAGNADRLGPINDPVMPRKKGEKPGVAPVKICDVCNCRNHTSARVCMVCATVFPENVKYAIQASHTELIAASAPKEEIVIKVHRVTNVVYDVSRRAGRPDTLRAAFSCGMRKFQAHFCFEHNGFAKKLAHKYWSQAWDGDEADNAPPETILEAMEKLDRLKAPTHIRVWEKKPHPEIKAYDFSGSGFDGEGA